MPQYILTPDPDAFFGFSASQSGVDSSGNPFNKGKLAIGLKKFISDDVQNFKAANPGFEVREIPLLNLTASLSTSFNDSVTDKSSKTIMPGK